jgi:DNA polymerase I-like protein with 3'-5' exonuclease and polymerase domains
MKYAMLIAEKTIKERFDAQGLIRYHDEEQWQCRAEDADEVGRLGVQSIEKAARYLKLNVPVTGEYKIGNSWASTH